MAKAKIEDQSFRTYDKIPKPKPGEIYIFPRDNRLIDCTPYINTQANQPKWFRAVGKHQGSIRRCAGTVDYLSIGATMPLWTNVHFKPSLDSGGWEVSMDQMPYFDGFRLQGFTYESTGQCPMTKIRHTDSQHASYPKLVSPWNIMTAPGWSTILLPILFEPNPYYQVVPAVVNTDIYHEANLVLNITTNENFRIQAGTPMIHLIPFKRNKDFNDLKFMDESNFPLTTSRGFGKHQRFPNASTSAPYRQYSRIIDEEILKAENAAKKKFWRRKND